MADTKAPLPTEQQLIHSALEHVRRIFKGNGVKADSIKVASHTIKTQSLNAGTYLELKPVTSERVVQGKVVSGQLVATAEEAKRQIDQGMMMATRSPAIQAQISNELLRRPDQGFGLSRQAVPLEFLKKEFTWHESCQTCRGSAQAACPKCQGRRIETCVKCTGRGLMPCPLCRTTGLLQGVKCTRCLGHRYVACDGCQRSGMMACRTCNATGLAKCTTCNGLGWKSHIMTLAAQALTYFQYDPKSVPKGAADVIETQGAALATAGKITIKGRVADDKENVLGASYEVEFPYGEITFMVGKKEVKANLFGYKADITEFPNVLDKMLAATVEELEEAANNIGSVANTIKKATRYRIIAMAFLNVSRTTMKKTAATLMKNYDIGLSAGMAEKIATLADATTAHITRKPRYHGLFMGLTAFAAMAGCFYLLPARSVIAGYLPNQRFDIIIDIFALGLGGMMTTMAIQMNASGAVKKALGHLVPEGKKNAMMPRAGRLGLWGYAGVFVIMVILFEATYHTSSQTPYWYEGLTNFAVKTLGL